jgi:hypothetical protein
MTIRDPFSSAKDLALWVASVLQARGVDAIADWRMLEYWMQTELFRALRLKKAAGWRHLGDYEQPYFTRIPRAKSETKWVDLLVGHERDVALDRIIWIELKDLGRNTRTVEANAAGLGKDLAALWGISKDGTLNQWRKPPARAVDRGRQEAWKMLADTTEHADWWFGQIVLMPRQGFESITHNHIQDLWIGEFETRVKMKVLRPVIGLAETRAFKVYALVGQVPANGLPT